MPSSRSRPLLLALALAYAALTLLYSAVWMYGVRRGASAFLGVETTHDGARALRLVTRVLPGSGAERAGLRAGDAIAALNGHGLATRVAFEEAIATARPGDRLRLSVLRPGAPPMELVAELQAPPRRVTDAPFTRRLADEIVGAYPVLFLVVGIPVLFLRVDDRNAWLMALLFAGFIAGAPFNAAVVPQALRGVTLAYRLLFYAAMPALFFYTLAVFPEPSPLDRRFPLLKTVWLAIGIGAGLPMAVAALTSTPVVLQALTTAELPERTQLWTTLPYSLGGFALGLLSLAGNALGGSPETRRKVRVIVWGVLVGTTPMVVLRTVAGALGEDVYRLPFWIWTPCVMALLLVPLSFGYAVVKHRVLEVPVLLRRSARYLLVQRGALGLLMFLGAGTTLAFADSLAGYLQPRTAAALPTAALVGAAFGTVLIWAGNRVHRRVREQIDRAFFRSAYDARQVLQDLAERARLATNRRELADLIEHQVRSALLPQSVAVFLERRRGLLQRSGEEEGDVVAAGEPWLAALSARPHVLQLGSESAPSASMPAVLAQAAPECVVPVLARDGRLSGLITLGPRLSEEPYSREDRRLLASVAGQAGIALESISLAEEVAERLMAERRDAHEMGLAQQVQRRLLAQERPAVDTLEYTGHCLQARAVGGDYFDFLDLGPGRLGLVLADVSGKGLAAALLMAALQASLRSRDPEDFADLPRQLRAVNHLLYRASEISRYATLFIGIYESSSRRLTWANCGHNPPLLLRAGGEVVRLLPTAPVLGLLEEWDCTTEEATLQPGDVLAVFSDGVVEAFSDADEEYGEERLRRALAAQSGAPLEAALETIVADVCGFSGQHQDDDLTLVLARAR